MLGDGVCDNKGAGVWVPLGDAIGDGDGSGVCVTVGDGVAVGGLSAVWAFAPITVTSTKKSKNFPGTPARIGKWG